MTDRNFDDLAARFGRNIYGSGKGEIRLAVLWEHLTHNLPLEHGPQLRILDAGCGMGQVALRLAAAGHRVDLCDISVELLEQARAGFAEAGLLGRAEFHRASIQELSQERPGTYDLVLCHAVLEWLAQPRQTLRDAITMVKPGGHLSLMFFNRHSLVMRNLVRGNFFKVKSGDFSADSRSLTPPNPLYPETVYPWLADAGLREVFRGGVRVFHDYMERNTARRLPLEAIIEMEREYSCREPYLALARYLHVICQRLPE